MSRYAPLTKHLSESSTNLVRMSFSDIERIIGRKLPPSAETHRAWWSNNASNNVMTRAWLKAGFQSEQVDLPGRKLLFRRIEGDRAMPHFGEAQASFAADLPGMADKLALFGWMKGTVTVAPGVDLTEPADPEWGNVIGGEREPSS
jgi:hypothetical protein